MNLGEIQITLRNLESLKDLELPIKISFSISKNVEVLKSIVEDLEKERHKLCEKYAEKDESGKPKLITVPGNDTMSAYDMTSDNKKRFDAEYIELALIDHPVTFRTITYSDLEASDLSDRYHTLTPSEINALMFMIKDEEETVK